MTAIRRAWLPTWEPQLQLFAILVLYKCLEVKRGPRLKLCHKGWLLSSWAYDTGLVIALGLLFLADTCAASGTWHECQAEVLQS